MDIPAPVALLPRPTTDQKTLDALIDRYKTVRLRALKEDPQAFGSKYDDEVKFPRERWEARLQNPNAHTFIVLGDTVHRDTIHTASNDPNLSLLLTRTWLGTVTMVGPEPVPDPALSAEQLLGLFDSSRPDSSGRVVLKGSIIAYVLNGMYVLAEGRQSGNGRRLVERAVEHARQAGSAVGASESWLLIFVELDNEPALAFYQRSGFRAWNGDVLLGNRYVRMMDLRVPL